ncbi:MAG TPA: benzoate/H(+) symporter BenE family transporter, partial [Tabrizicola sp.]|nr:benzoate/H(+) symporter BenE family transporter [Tabrizicola sp.]
ASGAAHPAVAALAAFAAGILLAVLTGSDFSALHLAAPAFVPVAPAFDAAVILGLALPLYLVTMASQNLPGFATLRAAGYEPPVAQALTTTGLISSVTAFFGAHTVSMAAITAAICLGPDTPPVLALLAALPAPVVAALVALALLGPLMGALGGAFAAPDQRFAATVTLAVTASGVAAFGIGAAFWGLVAGIGVQLLERFKR